MSATGNKLKQSSQESAATPIVTIFENPTFPSPSLGPFEMSGLSLPRWGRPLPPTPHLTSSCILPITILWGTNYSK